MSKVQNYTLTDQGFIMPFSNNNLSNHHTVQTFIQSENHPSPKPLILSSASANNSRFDHEQAETMLVSESLQEPFAPYSAPGFAEKNKNLVGNKRKRNNNMLKEKQNDVIHVRAKRGQATDSHSLAERVRREKINEKLRCLQDLVPGCYKAMGMAVMLDVIINYVQSLQQQIEFLSMKLSAASMYFDFNTLEMDATEIVQRRVSTHESQEMERIAGGEGCGGLCYFNPTCPLY